jgi:riboflavin kinase / FMN adenylyltransferase
VRVATIGVFDGVHKGHRSLLAAARKLAGSNEVHALTFDPHPLAVLQGVGPSSLADLDYRRTLLKQAGADAVQILQFTEEMAAMNPESFVRRLLVETYGITDVVVGENFRFGARAAGDVAHMAQVGAPLGLVVHPQHLIGDDGGRWSSTRIRELIEAGDVVTAAAGLDRPYRLSGEVVRGEQRGRDLGYPTANLRWTPGATVPGEGVYAGWYVDDHTRFPAAISVGSNPQFDGTERSVEGYVLDRTDLDLYGRNISFDFVERLRGQERFADVSGLLSQMAADVDRTRLVLAPTERNA